jgi:hypothetical protein
MGQDWEANPGNTDTAIHAVYLPNPRSSKKVRAVSSSSADIDAGRLRAVLTEDATPYKATATLTES